MTPAMLLRGLARLLAVIAAAAIGGLAIGTALSKLSDDTESATGGTGDGSAPTTTTETSKKRASTKSRTPAKAVRVRIISAILHPASSASGKRRQRARVSVHVRVTNGSGRRLVPSRPVLVSGDDRVKTDPNQDTAATHLGALARGATRNVTLRFETAGAVTQRLRRELRARLLIAGRNATTSVKVGDPIESGS